MQWTSPFAHSCPNHHELSPHSHVTDTRAPLSSSEPSSTLPAPASEDQPVQIPPLKPTLFPASWHPGCSLLQETQVLPAPVSESGLTQTLHWDRDGGLVGQTALRLGPQAPAVPAEPAIRHQKSNFILAHSCPSVGTCLGWSLLRWPHCINPHWCLHNSTQTHGCDTQCLLPAQLSETMALAAAEKHKAGGNHLV